MYNSMLSMSEKSSQQWQVDTIVNRYDKQRLRLDSSIYVKT